MLASEFLIRYGIETSIINIDGPTIARNDRPSRPWFQATFTFPTGERRSIDYEIGGGVNDTLDTMSAAEIFYRMAMEAYDGEDYDEYISTYGDSVGVTRDQWEKGEVVIRERCRAWLPDDAMWGEFLSVEADS